MPFLEICIIAQSASKDEVKVAAVLARLNGLHRIWIKARTVMPRMLCLSGNTIRDTK